MSAKISQIIECPKCKIPMSFEGKEKPKSCPNCKFKLKSNDFEVIQDNFYWPKDIKKQTQDIENIYANKYADKPFYKLLEEMYPGKEIPKELKEEDIPKSTKLDIISKFVKQKRDEFFLTTNADELSGWIETLAYIYSLGICIGDMRLLHILVSHGKKIAGMTEAIELFLKNEGRTLENIHHQARNIDNNLLKKLEKLMTKEKKDGTK